MGFSTGRYATVWSVENKGKFTNVNLSTSRKNKDTGKYETDFSNFVAFVGEAHQMAANLKQGDRIKIGNCDASTTVVADKNDPEKKVKYHNYTVFSYEPAEGKPKEGPKTVQSEGEDPF